MQCRIRKFTEERKMLYFGAFLSSAFFQMKVALSFPMWVPLCGSTYTDIFELTRHFFYVCNNLFLCPLFWRHSSPQHSIYIPVKFLFWVVCSVCVCVFFANRSYPYLPAIPHDITKKEIECGQNKGQRTSSLQYQPITYCKKLQIII